MLQNSAHGGTSAFAPALSRVLPPSNQTGHSSIIVELNLPLRGCLVRCPSAAGISCSVGTGACRPHTLPQQRLRQYAGGNSPPHTHAHRQSAIVPLSAHRLKRNHGPGSRSCFSVYVEGYSAHQQGETVTDLTFRVCDACFMAPAVSLLVGAWVCQ